MTDGFGMDGPVEPLKIAVSVLFEGTIEKEGAFKTVADFQEALQNWLAETQQPVSVEYCETAFGDPPPEG